MPTVRLLPFTVTVAAPLDSVPDPRVTVPFKKVTLPVGTLDPLAALTVAFNWVVPVAAMLAGLADNAVLVDTGGEVTVIGTELVDLLKFPVGT